VNVFRLTAVWLIVGHYPIHLDVQKDLTCKKRDVVTVVSIQKLATVFLNDNLSAQSDPVSTYLLTSNVHLDQSLENG